MDPFDAWIEKQIRLIDLERDEETYLLNDKIASLSAKACQNDGLSILNLDIESNSSALFGRCCLNLRKLDKNQALPQCFKVGDEVCLYNPKHKSNSNSSTILLGIVSKLTHHNIEITVDELDDAGNYFEPPLRLDLRSSQKTHSTMKTALHTIQEHGRYHPLVRLLFYPEQCGTTATSPVSSSSTAPAPAAVYTSPLLQPSDHDPGLSFPLWNPGLNSSQQEAVRCSLAAPTVSIVHGPPGTGKTSTLTELILQAAHRHMKILVCAPSNVAVDTVLARLDSFSTGHNNDQSGRTTAKSVSTTSNAAAAVTTEPVPVLGANAKSSSSSTTATTTTTNAATRSGRTPLQMVRVGHPARISPQIMKYALDSLISRDEGTEIVKDVRRDIEKLRNEMYSRGNKSKSKKKEGAADQEGTSGEGSSRAAVRRQQRLELKALRKEANEREREVVARLLRRANVVLCTCVGAGSKLLRDLEFDLVVIDEAAQSLEAACWIPILKCRNKTISSGAGGRNNNSIHHPGTAYDGPSKCVLAGDHCQLPPTIKCVEAERSGLSVTLFERLINCPAASSTNSSTASGSSSINSSRGPATGTAAAKATGASADADVEEVPAVIKGGGKRFSSVTRLLDTQYRMNQLISDWASVQMYQGHIRSHDSVAHHTLRDILPVSVTTTSSSSSNSSHSSHSSRRRNESEKGQEQDQEEEEEEEEEEDQEDSDIPVMLLVDTSGLGMFEVKSEDTSSSKQLNSTGSNDPTKRNTNSSSSHCNYHEVELVYQHVLALVRAGVHPTQIGVITPYNGQLEVLRDRFFPSTDLAAASTSTAAAASSSSSSSSRDRKGKQQATATGTGRGMTGMTGRGFTNTSKTPVQKNPLVSAADRKQDQQALADIQTTASRSVCAGDLLKGLEIKTIDGFQGGEKECILLSLVRSNPDRQVGFLGEKRRINVAVTRAKRHLAVFCDVDTVSSNAFMATLVGHMSGLGDHLSAQEFIDFAHSAIGGVTGSTGRKGGSSHSSTGDADATTVIRSASGRVVSSTAGINAEKKNKGPVTSTINAAAAAVGEKVKMDPAAFMEVLSLLKSNDQQMLLARSTENNNNSKDSKMVNGAQKLPVIIEIQAKRISTPSVVSADTTTAAPIAVADPAAIEIVRAEYFPDLQLLRFSSTTNAYVRMLVHECAEQLHLHHGSRNISSTSSSGSSGSSGQQQTAPQRVLEVSNFPLHLISPSVAAASTSTATAAMESSPPAQPQNQQIVAPVRASSSSSSQVPIPVPVPISASHQQLVHDLNSASLNETAASNEEDEEGVEEEEDDELLQQEYSSNHAVTSKNKKKNQTKKKKKQQKQQQASGGGSVGASGFYVNTARVDAMKRLEHQHTQEENKIIEADEGEDAILEAAIAHNQRMAHLNQYRIGLGTAGAMPNPDKVKSRELLRNKLGEAAMARTTGSSTHSNTGSTASSGGGGGGGSAGTSTGGRVVGGGIGSASNIHGLFGSSTASNDSSTSNNSSGGGGTNGGKSSGTSRKKVVKKPPPNFGGGKLGSK